MKKANLLCFGFSLIASIAFALNLNASGQSLEAGAGRQVSVPKHEFSIQGSLSWNSISVSYAAKKGADISHADDYNLKYSTFFPAGFEYTYHFDSNWGITTGLGLSHHPYFVEGSLGPHTVILTGEYRILPGNNPVVASEYNFKDEHFSMVLDYLTIPILGKYMLPIGKGFHFYTQAGLRLGFLMNGSAEMHAFDGYSLTEYKLNGGQTTTQVDGYASCDIKKELFFSHYRSTDADDDDDTDYFRKINLYASLEAGVRIPISGSLGLYAAGFIDVGMIRPISRNAHIYPVVENGALVSVPPLENYSPISSLDIARKDANMVVSAHSEPFIKKMVPISAGLKLKLAF